MSQSLKEAAALAEAVHAVAKIKYSIAEEAEYNAELAQCRANDAYDAAHDALSQAISTLNAARNAASLAARIAARADAVATREA